MRYEDIKNVIKYAAFLRSFLFQMQGKLSSIYLLDPAR